MKEVPNCVDQDQAILYVFRHSCTIRTRKGRFFTKSERLEGFYLQNDGIFDHLT